MSKQETRSAIQDLTDALGRMAARTIKAEEERDAATRLAESWLHNWQEKEKECAELRAEVERLHGVERKLRHYIDDISGVAEIPMDAVKKAMSGGEDHV